MNSICIIIPARYEASRFPGKLLEEIKGRSILNHVYTNCKTVDLVAKVLIATDDQRIADHCTLHSMDYLMTKTSHQSGTDRIAEAASLLEDQYDYIINVQGDEPLISSVQINKLIQLLINKQASIATLYKIECAPSTNNPNAVKLVCDKNNKVLYFSRNTIPYSRDQEQDLKLKHHIGIYGFKSEVLQELTLLPVSELEGIEKLEQLRWMENAYDIYADETEYSGFGIDTPADLKILNVLIEEGSIKIQEA